MNCSVEGNGIKEDNLMKDFFQQYEAPVTEEQIERLRSFTTPEFCDGVGLYHTMDAEICCRAT